MKTEIPHDSENQRKWSGKRVLYTANNPPPKRGIDFTNDPGKTDASQAADCDINNILKKFQQTGILPGSNVEQLFSDVSDAPSYQEALNLVLHAQEQFMALDAHTRARFHNEPEEFMKFVHDPENASDLVKMGLATLTPKDDIDRLTTGITDALKGMPEPPLPADPAPAPAARTRKPT